MTSLSQITPEASRKIPVAVPGDLSWYAIQTMPRHEKKVAAELDRKEIQAFLPLVSEKRQWSDRQRLIETPLFPGYVFVKVASNLEERIPVLRTVGVTSFVGVRGIGIPIPESQISAVQTVVEQKLRFNPYPFLDVGKRVRIRGGSLDGMEGILVAVKGDCSLVISVELIQRSLAISVEGYGVESV